MRRPDTPHINRSSAAGGDGLGIRNKTPLHANYLKKLGFCELVRQQSLRRQNYSQKPDFFDAHPPQRYSLPPETYATAAARSKQAALRAFRGRADKHLFARGNSPRKFRF